MKRGVPVSPGVAVARAYCIPSVLAPREPNLIDQAALSGEVQRFDNACAAAAAELEAVAARVSNQVGREQGAIFLAHRALLRDPALVGRVKAAILDRQVDAETALRELLDEYAGFFAKIQDAYLKERLDDIRDVVGRVLSHLALHQARPVLEVNEPFILVAPEILPSQVTMFDRLHVAGILTETGGTTGHAAILARSLGIPAVSGLRGILHEVGTGDLIALDGREGHVYLRPGPEVESAYRKLQREYGDLRDRLIENRDQEPIAADGVRVELLANVNGPADALLAAKAGACGVGLYRTEYLFLTHPSLPDEEEQLAAYKAVIEAAPNNRVTVRTLDIGGDKQLPYFGQQREANPFMGWRSIRLSLAHPELFQTQLRAIFRAARFGQVSLLLPMISTLEEVLRLKKVIERTRLALRREGVLIGEPLPLGVMIEVPAAALCIDAILNEVDFVSIGSNDLIQYVMAADRDNPKVAHLCEPFSPAILRLLSQVIKACNERGKPVTLCGEMAGRPRLFLPLFGMGLTRLSMSPSFLPTIKEVLRCTSQQGAREIADRVLAMATVGEVRGYLTRRLRLICPNVTLLDTRH
ncbi:phosphoenolpyruvate protein kinase [Planctomycetaceae bacterium SCGC AG-212-F19]|nr:phosphoenolpyruvate protein kinase [Planctomycetaceae bacterium SCGC AG-212-F19]